MHFHLLWSSIWPRAIAHTWLPGAAHLVEELLKLDWIDLHFLIVIHGFMQVLEIVHERRQLALAFLSFILDHRIPEVLFVFFAKIDILHPLLRLISIIYLLIHSSEYLTFSPSPIALLQVDQTLHLHHYLLHLFIFFGYFTFLLLVKLTRNNLICFGALGLFTFHLSLQDGYLVMLDLDLEILQSQLFWNMIVLWIEAYDLLF